MGVLVRVVAWASILVAVGCSAEPVPGQGDESEGGRAEPVVASDAGRPAPERIDVAGVLATALEGPVVGRAVLLVDGSGERREELSGDDGRFSFSGVAPPYDLVAVTRAGSCMAYLGLTRPDPYLELDDERAGPAPEGQSVRVEVEAPCEEGGCWLTVVTASPSGRGAVTIPDWESGAGSVEIEHVFRRSPPAGEVLELHALVRDEARESFAYARTSGVAAAPGALTPVGRVVPERVAATAQVELGARWEGLHLGEWRWRTEAALDLGGGAELPLAADPAPSVVVRLPLLPRAALRVGTVATDPGGDRSFGRWSEAWSGAQAFAAGAAWAPGRAPAASEALPIVVGEGAEIIQPSGGGHVTRGAVAFAWRGGAGPALATVSVVDRARGALRFRALTGAEDLPATRLSALGLAALLPGEHTLEVVTSPSSSVHEATSPDPAARRRRLDRASPGAAVHLRAAFQVRP